MRVFAEIINRLRALFGNRSVAKDVDAELQQHLDFMIEDYVAEGMSPAPGASRGDTSCGKRVKPRDERMPDCVPRLDVDHFTSRTLSRYHSQGFCFQSTKRIMRRMSVIFMPRRQPPLAIVCIGILMWFQPLVG